MDPPNSEETLNHLVRLGQKQGVRSYLILARADGAIIRSSGFGTDVPAPAANATETPATNQQGEGYTNGADAEGQSAEAIARLVCSFVDSAKTLGEGFDGSDAEMKLLRLRTKKKELVIVPGPKFLLVVVHDTPPA